MEAIEQEMTSASELARLNGTSPVTVASVVTPICSGYCSSLLDGTTSVCLASSM